MTVKKISRLIDKQMEILRKQSLEMFLKYHNTYYFGQTRRDYFYWMLKENYYTLSLKELSSITLADENVLKEIVSRARNYIKGN